MDVSFANPHLRALDGVQADAFMMPWFEGELPLIGALGLIDWRLAGWLSNLLARQDFELSQNEHCMVGLSGKFSVPRLLLCGLGPAEDFDEDRFLSALRLSTRVAKQAQLRRLALELPGRAHDLIAPARAIELIFHDEPVSVQLDDMVLIDTAIAQQEVQTTVRSLVAGKRRRSQLPGPVTSPTEAD